MARYFTLLFQRSSALILVFLCVGFCSTAVNAQNGVCGTDYYWQQQLAKNPGLYQERLNYDMQLALSQKQYKTEATNGAGTKRVIPVVFHIIHNYGPENISKQNILDQLATINRNYQKLNSDTSLVRSVFKNLVANCNLEFRLATKDPNGNCTDGIDRVASTETYSGAENVKSLVIWNSSKYLNIWVVQTIDMGAPPGTVIAGYSQFPTTNSPSTDGIVVRSDNVNSSSNTLTHEIGHYFNLYHTFQGGCGSGCSTSGDFVCDTPPTANANYGCNTNLNTCSNDQGGDKPDMIENYMDYSNCSHMFTIGQSSRIDASLISTRRASLITTANLASTGVDSTSLASPSCALPKADFYANSYSVCKGGTVTFKDNSFNATVTSWQWTIPNASPASGSTTASANPTFYFPDTGYYSVTLKVSNTNGSSQASKTAYIHVVPAASTVNNISQDFEKGIPSKWQFPKDNNGTGWVITTKAATSGSNSVYLNTLNTKTDSIYSFTIPEIDLAANHNQVLSFKMAFAQKSAASNDILRIYVADVCAYVPPKFISASYLSGAALATAHAYHTSDFVPASDEWREVTVDLSPYKNVQKLAVRFWFQNRSGNNIYIDDINLGDPSGINNTGITERSLTLYPNPTTGDFTLQCPTGLYGDSRIEAFDISGKNIGTLKIQAAPGGSVIVSKQSLNLNSDGVYYIKLIVGSNIFVQKLIVLGSN
jgi:PKD repeat protein